MKKTKIFQNIENEDINKMLKCFEAKKRVFKKESIIMNYLGNTSTIGIITKGKAELIRNDYNGNRTIIETLTEDDFYREDNKIIYKAILNLYNRAEPIDIITLKSELSAMGKFEAVGGLEYLAELPDKVPTTSNVERYIKIVEEKSTLRTLIKTANDLISLGYLIIQDYLKVY